MDTMSDKEINRIVSNDKEWRKHIFRTIEEVKRDQKDIQTAQNNMTIEMTTLKVKVAFFGGISGTIFGAFSAWIVSKL